MPTKFQANDRVMDQHGNIGTIEYVYDPGSPGAGAIESPLYEFVMDDGSYALRWADELRRFCCDAPVSDTLHPYCMNCGTDIQQERAS